MSTYRAAAETYVYPDVMVVCGGFAYAEGHRDMITNPVVVWCCRSRRRHGIEAGSLSSTGERRACGRLGRLFPVLLFWMFKETMKDRDVIAMVEADGWTVSR